MIFLALRYLWARPLQTILIVFGIILGAAAFVGISGLMDGFQDFIVDQLVNNDSHIRVSSREQPITKSEIEGLIFQNQIVKWLTPPSGRRDSAKIENPHGWFELLDRDPEVAAYSPQLVIQAIARRGKTSTAVRLIGSDVVKQIKVSTINSYMVEGKLEDIGATGNRIVIGQALLNLIGARVSESIMISVAKGTPIPFKIVGSFNIGVKGIDETTIFASLKDVQKVNQTPSVISDIAIRLHDVTLARDKATNWSLLSPDKVQSWDQANSNILSVFTTQNITRNFMTISILVVAAFGIYNVLNMTINQKRREIAILRSVGFNSKDVLLIFLLQGTILGTAGGLIGSFLGYIVSLILAGIEVDPGRAIGGGKMMISFNFFIYVQAFVLSMGSSLIASYLPSRAAGKLTPIDIIRSGE